MDRRCVSQGSLAAVLAALCVLGPGSPAIASGDGSSPVLLDRGRCCAPARLATVTPQGQQVPAARSWPDGRAQPGGAGRAQGAPLAQAGEPSGEPAGEAPPAPPAQDEPPTTELPQDDGKIPVTVPADTPESFKGSPKPAGPDLTPSEERELISRGWQ